MLIKLAARYSPFLQIAEKHGEEGLQIFKNLLYQKNGNFGLARSAFNRLELPTVTRKVPTLVKDIQKATHPPLFTLTN